MIVHHRGFTLTTATVNSFGDQLVVVVNLDHDIVYQSVNTEGSWLTSELEAKHLIDIILNTGV